MSESNNDPNNNFNSSTSPIDSSTSPTDPSTSLTDLSTSVVGPSEDNTYYPCNDPDKPVCRQFVNQTNCRQKQRCRFYHPPIITSIIKKKASRELGCCYCGAFQKKLLNKRGYRVGEDSDVPIFFVVCGRTGKSMRRCM